MLLVKRPQKSDLMQVLQGLLDGKYSREEVLSWHSAIVGEYADLHMAVADGYWYFQSLSALTIPIDLGDGEAFFIRLRDIEEYLLDLQRVGAEESYQGVTRVRSHQTDPEAVRWPLLMFEHTDVWKMEDLGLRSVRGLFDVHLDLVEHTHVFFKGDLYLMVRQYDDQAHQLMILGTNRDEDQLREFMKILGFV